MERDNCHHYDNVPMADGDGTTKAFIELHRISDVAIHCRANLGHTEGGTYMEGVAKDTIVNTVQDFENWLDGVKWENRLV